MLGRQPKLIATMKKLFLIVAAMFAVVSFSACSDDDKDINPNQIIGTWQITREVGYEIVAGEGKMEKDIVIMIAFVLGFILLIHSMKTERGDIKATIIMIIINWIVIGLLNTQFLITNY